MPFEILALNKGSDSEFHNAVSAAVIPFATLALNKGSFSIKLLNFLFQYAVSTAVIPFEMLALNKGSNSVNGPVTFSADLAYIEKGTLSS